MNPYTYTKKNNKTIFHYKFSELREFITHGKKHGNNGTILISRKHSMLTFKGFGTIENPIFNLHSITIVHCKEFDGKMRSDKDRINPHEKECDKTSFRSTFIDLSKINNL